MNEGDASAPWGQNVRFTFLHTSDIHSRLLPFDFAPTRTDSDLGLIPEAGPFGGVARLGALIRRERGKSDRVLHVDSGDSFQGAPIYNVNNGEVEYRFLSNVRLDAAVVGNHEFDSGAASFTDKLKNWANFPVLAANYAWDDYRTLDSNQTGFYTQPYTVRTVGGVRVAIIGMANISSLNSLVEGGNSLQATPLEQNEAARGYVELLRPSVDLIVMVSHLGLTEDQELVQGYEAFYEFGRIQEYLNRSYEKWTVLEWFGPEGDSKSVVRVHVPGVRGIDLILGGHLHVVLNPPQKLTDADGRTVILSHGGAFAKYLSRMDIVLKMPTQAGTADGAEIISHDYRVFPVDSLWCSEEMHAFYKEKFWGTGAFMRDPGVVAAVKECAEKEDPLTTQLLQPYILNLDFKLALTSLFAYAPRDIARRNNSTGGDAPLGNLAADSMRKRRRVEAEVAVTNSLGIRDNLYAGPLTQESMFNVFPFENTINVMYLSGVEMQEMFDFITDRSATRGCLAQAQVSGARFTMDCAQVQLNDLRMPCNAAAPAAQLGSECGNDDRTGRAPWTCINDVTGGRCWAHTGTNIFINGKPLDNFATYRVAVNDYIAKGGSGFSVLKRNTTRIETGIPLRDSLVGYVQSFCTCDDVLEDRRDEGGNIIGAKGQLCGFLIDGKWQLDPQEAAFCKATKDYAKALRNPVGTCSCLDVFRGNPTCAGALEPLKAQCLKDIPAGPALGKCVCRDALAGDPSCGHVTQEIRNFCENPTSLAIAAGAEDGRIARKVK